MPYNQALDQRIQSIIGNRPGISAKKMFGGVGYMLHGNLVCGVQGEELIVRVGPDKNDASLALPYVRPFPAPGGKPMAGWILVAPQGWENELDLAGWIDKGFEYASTLPEKK